MTHKFPYEWLLANGYPAKNIKAHNSKVFGTFVCGGGSTMGYKLAGYEHLGGVEIDPKIAKIYKENHKPKLFYTEDIRTFNNRSDLPKELFNLDLLDGSPPCSSFSMSGNREKDWGKEKKFAEGQTKQRLDDLVFEYIKTIDNLKPKIALLENVKGLLIGNAKAYSKQIKKQFERAGYKVQVFLLNSASMGVPQKRERVFFIGFRNDFDLPRLNLKFNETSIVYKEFKSDLKGLPLTKETYKIWLHRKKTDLDFSAIHERLGNKRKRFLLKFIHENSTPSTLLAGPDSIPVRFDIPHRITDNELKLIGSFPLDYEFKSIKPYYLIGMSVPPVMTAQIAHQIYLQWLKKISNG